MRKRRADDEARESANVVLGYIAQRVAIGIATLAIVSVVVFLLTQALPGDIARQVLGQNATPEQLQALREQLGLERPLIVQYFSWLGGILTLDLGTALSSGTPVAELLSVRAANTATVVLVALVIVIPAAIALGVFAARRSGRAADHVISTTMFAILALPEFVVGIVVIAALAGPALRLFPPTSILDPRYPALSQPALLVLPVITMILIALPHLTESVKALVRDELGSEHVLWSRLGGVREQRLMLRGVLPNVASPTAQVVVATINFLVGGTVAVEVVFGFPGIGSALVAAVANRDIVVVQAIAMGIALILVVAFLVADLVGFITTPRLRTAGASR